MNMGSDYYSSDRCYEKAEWLYTAHFTCGNGESLWKICGEPLFQICNQLYDSEHMEKFSKPMVWIGIYVTIASLFCILAMTADLLHGFRNRKFWFPCKYFSLNAVSITLISIAMKLPMDMSSPMLGYVDQVAKLGSMAFMCTMMANLMPSLAPMGNKKLFANVMGFAIFVITMIVNIYIEIHTGVIEGEPFTLSINKYTFIEPHFMKVAYIYVAMILLLLMILISSAITIPTSKQILEFKYQATTKITLDDQHPEHTKMSKVEKLRQHVRRYWVMAETGSPEFVIASNPLSTASSVLCVISLVMYIFVVAQVLSYPLLLRYQSNYKWSILSIVITHSIGVVVGTITSIFRCFTVLKFKLLSKWNKNHLMVFKVEKYWTHKLYKWKESRIPILSSGRRSRTLGHTFKNLILSCCIGIQKVIVVSCKMIGLVPVSVLIVVVHCSYCWKSLKAMLFTPTIASSSGDINEDLSNYVLQLEDEMGIAEKTLKDILNSMTCLIQKAEKEQHNNILNLLEKSTGFKGVENFDTDQVQPLLSVELVNNWSLPVVTLTCIVIALPNIPKDIVDGLFRGVREGLLYTHVVEESLNNANEYVNIQRATMTLWHEVEDNCKWLENTLGKNAYKGKTSTEILKWFANKAKEIVIEINKSTNGELEENFSNKMIVANSMYRIAQTILLSHQNNIEPISEEQLFALLSGMIADIFVACLTNIPRVIMMKCHESVIEKREASVEAAIKFLGRTSEIIKRLEACELPSLDPGKMPFIDEWRAHLKQSMP